MDSPAYTYVYIFPPPGHQILTLKAPIIITQLLGIFHNQSQLYFYDDLFRYKVFRFIIMRFCDFIPFSMVNQVGWTEIPQNMYEFILHPAHNINFMQYH